MSTLFLISGLGNQMFQYAFARMVQEQSGAERLEIAPYENNLSENNHLSNLQLTDNCTIISDRDFKWRKAKFQFLNYLYRLSHLRMPKNIVTNSLLKFTSHDQYYYEQLDFHNVKKDAVICGQFQTPLWFDKYREILKKELMVKTRPSAANIAAIQEIKGCNSVCVHIRRGDYLNPEWQHLNICDYEYYRDAIGYIQRQTVNPVFFIFSNNSEEIEWIRNNYHFEGDIRYIDLNNPDYEELRLMYSCKHFIISNSSFSWWAQYLSEDKAKIVCAPSIWNRENGGRNIYMDSWELIDVK